MRFRIRSLLFVPIAWAVAYLIACNFLVNHAFVSWNHNIARSNIQQIQTIAQRLYAENPAIGLTEFSDHQWIAGSLESPDPWGHRYQIRKIGQPNRELQTACPFHVFSFGKDGVTQSDGNDLDDINSWDAESHRFYTRRVASYWESEKLWQTVWTTPILLALAWLVKAGINQNSQADKTVT